MYSRIFINFLLIIGLVLLQISLVNGLPVIFKNINLIIIALVFILGLGSFNLAFWWAVGSGFLLDLFSFMPFGINLFCLLTALLLVNFLLTNFFTNRSLYSFLVLNFFYTLIFRFFLITSNYLADSFVKKDFAINYNLNFFIDELSALILNFIIVVIVFYLLSFLSSRFKPVFLKNR
jgi:rod shape-determining protein MreD